MRQLVESILNKNFDEAKDILHEEMSVIVDRKLTEEKKRCAARMEQTTAVRKAFDGNPGARQEKLYRGVIEEDDIDEDKTQMVSMGNKPFGKKLVIKPKSKVGQTYKDMDKGSKLERIKKAFSLTQEETLAEETENLSEAPRIMIVKARIRGGKIQRRKKVSTVPGMTMRGGRLIRMSPAERRRRKMGARRAAIKERGKRSQILRKRKISMMKRSRLGI